MKLLTGNNFENIGPHSTMGRRIGINNSHAAGWEGGELELKDLAGFDVDAHSLCEPA